jgi:alpha/beta superfamily hydrolase
VKLAAAVLALASFAACAQDYGREKRWAEQVVPNLVVGDAVQLRLPAGREFLGIHTEASKPRAAVLLVHGVGVHPDHGVIGILRAALADAGYTTLAIQMPVQASDARVDDYYPTVFPEAVQRIAAGAAWLRDKGAGRIVLLSHSMGSWMSNVYYEETANAPFAAWVCMGLTGGFGRMGNVKVPVLDLYGENDLPPVLRAEWRRKSTIEGIAGSSQEKIAGADHHFLGKEKELTAAIHDFIGKLK